MSSGPVDVGRPNLEGLQIAPSARKRRSPLILWLIPLIVLVLIGLVVLRYATQDDGSQRMMSTDEAKNGPAKRKSAKGGAPAGDGVAQATPAPPAREDLLFETNGYIVPRERIEISPRFQATVSEILVGKGDRVKQGDLLVRLEDDEYRTRVAQFDAEVRISEAELAELHAGARKEDLERARWSVAFAQSNLNTAELNLKRRRELVASGSMAQEQIDEALRTQETAAAQLAMARQDQALLEAGARAERIAQADARLAAARAALANSGVFLNWCTITSPIDGTILTREVDPGELVVPQSFGGGRGPSTSFLSMADLTDLQVQIDLNEQFTSKVFLDQLCEISPLAYPDKKFTGYVFEVAPEANRAKGTLEVKVQIIKPDVSLTPELSAQVKFLKPKHDGAAADRAKRRRRTQ